MKAKMTIISITGTPGTGKSAAAKELSNMLKARLIRQNDIVSVMKTTVDKERKVKIVDEKKIRKSANKMLSDGINIIEGHLSHFAKPDMAIVLRCRPDVLEKRLKARGYSKAKILENVQAEILDASTIEALEECGKGRVYEINTTWLSPAQTAGLIARIIRTGKGKGAKPPKGNMFLPGKIDWTEKWKKYLIESVK